MNVHLSSNGGTQPDGSSDDLFDYALIRHCIGYVLRSIKRHPWLLVAVFLLTVATTVFVLWGMPKTYHTETKILAQRNQVIAALGNPDRRVPYDADAPTRAAADTVLSRDSLVALIQQTNLTERWDESRAPFLRVKDGLVELVKGKLTPDDKVEALVGVLEKKLWVAAEEGAVTIGIDWPDPRMAFLLVDGSRQNLLETRHAKEISTIAEAISILEAHAEEMRETITTLSEELNKQGKSTERAPMVLRRRSTQPDSDPEIAQLEVILTEKRRSIDDLESFRQRRLAELQAQLVEQKSTLADQHPAVLNTVSSIEALSRPSPQIVTLRREAGELQSEIDRRIAQAKERKEQRQAEFLVPADAERTSRDGDAMKPARAETSSATDFEFLRMRLDFARGKYDELLSRSDAARIELDAARAAFKYRYSVVKPPKVDNKPIKPNAPMVVVGGVLAGLVLGVLAAVARDLRSRRILESWQIERGLDLPLLGEVRQ